MFLHYKNKKSVEDIEKDIARIREQATSFTKRNEKGVFILGDNFNAMSMLLDEFENKIDLIYIDPHSIQNLIFIIMKIGLLI